MLSRAQNTGALAAAKAADFIAELQSPSITADDAGLERIFTGVLAWPWPAA